MMIYKERYPKAFVILSEFGMPVTPLSEALSKWRLGFAIAFVNLIQVTFSLYAVKNVSIPIFQTFRRGSLLTTFIVNYIVGGKYPDSYAVAKLSVVIFGVILSGWENLNRDWLGYILVWSTNMSGSIYGVFVNKYNNDNKVTAFELNFYYAWIGLPIFLVACVAFDEIHLIWHGLAYSNPSDQFYFYFLMFLSGSLGIGITLTTLLVVTLGTAFSLNIVGNFKNALSTFLSFFVFDDLKPSLMNVSGISVALFGSLIYLYDEVKERQRKQKS